VERIAIENELRLRRFEDPRGLPVAIHRITIRLLILHDPRVISMTDVVRGMCCDVAARFRDVCMTDNKYIE